MNDMPLHMIILGAVGFLLIGGMNVFAARNIYNTGYDWIVAPIIMISIFLLIFGLRAAKIEYSMEKEEYL